MLLIALQCEFSRVLNIELLLRVLLSVITIPFNLLKYISIQFSSINNW